MASRCEYCGAPLRKGQQQYIEDEKNYRIRYCNEEHKELYYKQKEEKKKASMPPPKPRPEPKPKPTDPPPISEYKKLTDYIDSIWPIEVNWQWFTSQIKRLCNDYCIDYYEMRMVIKYCVEYLNMKPNECYGLQQYIPKYIEEERKFIKDIENNKQIAETMDLEEEVILIKPRKITSLRLVGDKKF